MSTAGIASLSLAEVAAAIRARQLSSLEATEAALARIERFGAGLGCIAAIDPDAARAAARAADAEQAAGRVRGPLHGVPLAHKDMFYRKGRLAECGSRIRKGHVAERTATALERLDAAGALDIARLNMVEFALGITGHNEITGTPRNPWNTDHVPGGSSSGSGVAVAARLVFGALGSDTGGSIRMPAACNGLVGLKPTYGRTSRHAAMPLSFTLDHVGPLTRTVGDAALMLQAIAGHDAMDTTTSSRPVPDYLDGLEAGVRGLRIAVPEGSLMAPVDSEMRALLEETLRVYRGLGATTVPVVIPGLEPVNGLVTLIIASEGAALHARWLRERPQDYGEQTRGRLLPGLVHPATRYLEALRLRGDLMRRFADAVFSVADVLLAPVLPWAVPTIEETDLRARPGFADYLLSFGHLMRPFNYLGLPALAFPTGFTANGLPAGMQLVGRPFAEPLLLRAARAYERETGWTGMAPPLD